MLDRLYTTKEAAKILRKSIRTLERYRQYGTGPRFIREGGNVFYRLGDLKQWQDENSAIY